MRALAWTLVGTLTAAAVVGTVSPVAASGMRVIGTKPQPVGNGWARAYLALDENGNPLALGVRLDKAALEGLPADLNPTSRCFDKNGNGKIDDDECIGDYQRVFTVPAGEAADAVSPFKWIGLNWNPHGHAPPAPPAWAVPHFDFHFYLATREQIKAIRPGKCGELIDCHDFETATRPVPAKYVPHDHIDVGAAVPDMGNHLIDSKAPELAKNGPRFTYTFIFGSYDGHIVFFEPMITRAYLATDPSMCTHIKQPQAWEVGGFYPTKYCVRHLSEPERYTVSLEDFRRRPAE